MRQKRQPGTEIRLSEVMSAMSYALDITEGQPEGHAARSCVIGMRIARELGLNSDQSSSLFYALLLKDVGCSSNAAKICYLFGNDDRQVKCNVKTRDWTCFSEALKYSLQAVAPQASIFRKFGLLARLALRGQRGAKELIQIRCERGANIARYLGMAEVTAQAILALDEHWDGLGHPLGLCGDQIPLPGRILGLSQTVEVFLAKHGLDAAIEMATRRSGTWFDPELVRILISLKNDQPFWQQLEADDPGTLVTALEPIDHAILADDAHLDRIAEGFAEVIDAKSPWTFRHSKGVAELSTGIGKLLGFSAEQLRMLNRAALLHDIGKLGVSNTILDKPGKLTPDELIIMKRHPRYTLEILERVRGFSPFAELAASHHERIDGNGYHRGIRGGALPTGVRILAVADMYEALASKRPYRQDLTAEEVMVIMDKNAGPGICPHILEALKTYLEKGAFAPVKLVA